MKILKKELEKLKGFYEAGNEKDFQKQVDFLHSNFVSEQEKSEIEKFTTSLLTELTRQTDNFINDITVRMQLGEVAEIVSMAYLSKRYFNRSRHWLYQKINGNVKNGRRAHFTQTERNTLNFALRDISNKIGSVNIA